MDIKMGVALSGLATTGSIRHKATLSYGTSS